MEDNAVKRDGFGIGEAGGVPASTIEDEIEAARLSGRRAQKMVRCSCGHTVPESWVMSASRGTACPDCYDRLSD